jgi:hypothetical protein
LSTLRWTARSESVDGAVCTAKKAFQKNKRIVILPGYTCLSVYHQRTPCVLSVRAIEARPNTSCHNLSKPNINQAPILGDVKRSMSCDSKAAIAAYSKKENCISTPCVCQSSLVNMYNKNRFKAQAQRAAFDNGGSSPPLYCVWGGSLCRE